MLPKQTLPEETEQALKAHWQRLGKEGGDARAKKLTKARRVQIAKLAAKKRWPKKRSK